MAYFKQAQRNKDCNVYGSILFSLWCSSVAPWQLESVLVKLNHWKHIYKMLKIHFCISHEMWNWMAACLSYTLRMRTLFRGWPIMVNDTHTRRMKCVKSLKVRWANFCPSGVMLCTKTYKNRGEDIFETHCIWYCIRQKICNTLNWSFIVTPIKQHVNIETQKKML